jgi:DNA-binding protein H-NS
VAKQSMKLDKMALSELVQLRDEVQAAINRRVQTERRDLQAKLAEIDKLENGAKPATPVKTTPVQNGKQHPAQGKKVAAKYRGPNGEAWAGRGLTPRWLAELEGKGESREQYLIKA